MILHSIGVNELHDGDYSVNRTNYFKTYLLLMLRTPAMFCFDNEWTELSEATAVLYPPQSVQQYKAIGNAYIDDWLHIEADSREIERFGIILNKPLVIRDVERTYTVFRLMKEEYVTHGYVNTNVVESLLNALLFKLSESCEFIPNSTLSVDKIHSEVWQFPMKEWFLADAARSAHLSVSRFEALYSKEYGDSFTADVINARIEYAKDLLDTSDLSVKKISEKCGYTDENYFSRQFKSKTGVTPTEWRNKQHYLT